MLQLPGGRGILRASFFFFSFTTLSQFAFIQAVLHPANARQLLSEISLVTECFYSEVFLLTVNITVLSRRTNWHRPPDVSDNCCPSCRFPKGTLLRSWLTKSRPRLLLLIAGLKRPQVTLMRRKRMKRTKVAKAT